MSVVTVATLGTVLGGVIMFMTLPIAAKLGGLASALVGAIAATIVGFALGRGIANGLASALFGGFEAQGPVWAGGLPLRGPDFGIFAVFVVLSCAMTVALRRA